MKGDMKMGEQVGRVSSFRQKFIEAKNKLIQEGVQNPKTKDIIAAMKSQKAEAGQSPQESALTGLQVEQNPNLNQLSQRQEEMSGLMREKSNFQQFATKFLSSGYLSYISKYEQEYCNLMADQNISNEEKGPRLLELQNKIQAKREEFIQKSAIFEQMVNATYTSLMQEADLYNNEISEIQNNKNLTNEEKSQAIEQIQTKKLLNRSEVLTKLNNELDLLRHTLFGETEVETPTATQVPGETQSETVSEETSPESAVQTETQTSGEVPQATASQTETVPESPSQA